MTPGSIVLWAMIFGMPALFMLLAWIGFLTLFRAELSRIFAWPALIFTTSSVWAAIWAIAHIHELAKGLLWIMDSSAEFSPWLLLDS